MSKDSIVKTSGYQQKVAVDVIVDTNAIFTRETTPIFAHKRFRDGVKTLQSLHDVVVYVPEVVLEETIQQKREALEAAYLGLKQHSSSLKALVGIDVGVTDSLNDLQAILEARLRENFVQSGYCLLPTKMVEHRWHDFVHAAIRRKGQFSSGDPSAFKDAVICATAIEHAKNVSGRRVVFICNDKEARKLEMFDPKERETLTAIPSIDLLGSLVKQFTEENTKRLIEIRELASRRFYGASPMDLYFNSLFVAWDLHSELASLTGRSPHSMLESPMTSVCLTLAIDSKKFPPFRHEYSGTELVSIEGDRCAFESRVSYFYNTPSGLSTISLAATSVYGGAGYTVRCEEYHFTIKWAATFSGGELLDTAVERPILLTEKQSREVSESVPNYLSTSPLSALNSLADPTGAWLTGSGVIGFSPASASPLGVNLFSYSSPSAMQFGTGIK